MTRRLHKKNIHTNKKHKTLFEDKYDSIEHYLTIIEVLSIGMSRVLRYRKCFFYTVINCITSH
jgi:hypothetical protein